MDNKELSETKSVDSCSMFPCRYRHLLLCLMIILCTNPIGTRTWDFLSLLSKLDLEPAKRVGICRLKRVGIMRLWSADKVASLESRNCDA